MKGTLAVALIVFLCLSTFSAFTLKVNAQQSTGDWSMFHANPSHSGIGTGNPVLSPTLLWKSFTGVTTYSSPSVVGGVVYIGSQEGGLEPPSLGGHYAGFVFAFNTTSGAQLWNYTTGVAVYCSPAVADGVVYIGSEDFNVYALNSTNGDKLWNYTTGNDVLSSPAVVSGVVYIGSSDDNVYALNASNGAKLWNYTTGGSINLSPAVVDGIVFVSSFDHNVYALNATNGAKLWNYAMGNFAEDWSSPAVINGVVYIGWRMKTFTL